MLTLFCGAASYTERKRLLGSGLTDSTLVVVPDEMKARAFFKEHTQIVSDRKFPVKVVALPELLKQMFSAQQAKTWVPANIVRAAIRSIMGSDSKSYDYLVGTKSVPRLTESVLSRIVSGLDSLTMRDPSSENEDGYVSNREMQLRKLGRELEIRLTKFDLCQDKYGVLQALSELDFNIWNKHFPDIRHVIFTDFDKWSDTGFMTGNTVTRLAETVSVLLDYDPENELENHSPLEAAYLRFYEMADKLVLDDFSAPDAERSPLSSANRPVAVIANSTSEEVKAAAVLIKSFFSEDDTARPTSVTVALPNWDNYVAPLEHALENCNGSLAWFRDDMSLRSSQWRLLERLRDAGKVTVRAGDIASLWRAVGFAEITNNEISQIDCWNLAARLDYVITLSGQVVGWPRILRRFSATMRQVQSERQRKGQLSFDEVTLDEQLLKALEITRDVVANFKNKRPVGEWCNLTIGILQETVLNSNPAPEQVILLTHEMVNTALQISRFSGLISSYPMRFAEFLALYRTSLYNVSVNNAEQFEHAAVKICPPHIAASLFSDVCIVLGCNDGNFPTFARPETVFTDYQLRDNQTRHRASQRLLLQQLAQRHGRLLLWMPEREGIENLLPSQFIEELLEQNAITKTSAQTLMESMSLTLSNGDLNHPISELVHSIKGLTFTDSELRRFSRRGALIHNIAFTTNVMAHRAIPDLSSYDGIITDPQLKTWLSSWAQRHIYSVSQLDTVVGCSFRFFGERILNLEEIEESDDLLSASVFGSITHDVLARFYRQWVLDGRLIPTPDEEMIAREKLGKAFELQLPEISEVSEFATDLISIKLFGDFTLSSFMSGPGKLEAARNPGLLGQFLLLEMQRSVTMTFGSFRPSNFEVGFGQGKMDEDDPLSKPEPVDLNLGGGETIRLRGRIDRIDVNDEGVFAVTDYKTGATPAKKQISESYKTQLPIYALVAEQLLQSQFALPEAAGGLYYPLKPQSNAKVAGIFLKKAYQNQLGVGGRSCLSDEDYDVVLDKVRGYMRQSLRSVREGNLTTTWRDDSIVCPFCPFESLCYRNVERTKMYWTNRGLDEAIAKS